MMFPKHFFNSSDLSFVDDAVVPEPVVLTTPGQVYRDSLAFGTSPDMIRDAIFDDDDSTTLDPVCDLTVQKTDLIDKSFYQNNPDYQRPDSLKKAEVAPTVSTPTAPPAGDSAGDSDLIQSSAASVD